MNTIIKNGLLLGTMGIIALVLKKFYQMAEVPDLQWILAPTKNLVQGFTGLAFQYNTEEGYVNAGHQFAIAKSCAGVNFLIIAFCTSVFGFTIKMQRPIRQWLSIPLFLGIAYGLTIVVNAFRIIGALQFDNVSIQGLNANQLHETEGIVVYLSFLLIYFLSLNYFLNRTNLVSPSNPMIPSRTNQ